MQAVGAGTVSDGNADMSVIAPAPEEAEEAAETQGQYDNTDFTPAPASSFSYSQSFDDSAPAPAPAAAVIPGVGAEPGADATLGAGGGAEGAGEETDGVGALNVRSYVGGEGGNVDDGAVAAADEATDPSREESFYYDNFTDSAF